MDVKETYQQAYELWRHGRLAEAQQTLEKGWTTTGIRTLQGMLLMAYIYRDSGHYITEIEQLQKTLDIFPDAPEVELLADAWSMLGAALRVLGENDLSVQAFLTAAKVEPVPEKKLIECSNALFTSNAIEGISADKMQEMYAFYRRLLRALRVSPYALPTWKHDKIRVGYISADLYDHAVSQFIEPLFCEFDIAKFDVYVYQMNDRIDAVTKELQRGSAIWRQLHGVSLEELAAAIRSDEIDVLFDLSGHTADNMLPVFAWKAAPVQISGLGYFNSTGLHETTGFLSDVYCSVTEQSAYFTERLLRLPHSHFCYHPFTKFPEIGDAPCVRNGYVTFGCFNNFSKITDEMLLVWKQILARVPSAHLLLKHALLGTEEGRKYTIQRFEKLRLPLSRIELRGTSRDYLEQYHDLDIALDTSPYQGGLTTCEALYMGVPVITTIGSRHGSRFGYSFLSNIGLPELAAANQDGYVDIAVELSQDWDMIQLLHKKLRGIMKQSILMNSQQYMKNLESMYNRLAGYC